MFRMQPQTEPSPCSSSAEPQLLLLPPACARALPPEPIQWLHAALQGDPRGTLEGVLREIEQEKSQLWCIHARGEWRSVIVTRIFHFDACDVFRIQLCGGRELHSWEHLLRELEEHARELGCAMVEILGRKGWGRVYPDYRVRSVLMEKEL